MLGGLLAEKYEFELVGAESKVCGNCGLRVDFEVCTQLIGSYFEASSFGVPSPLEMFG